MVNLSIFAGAGAQFFDNNGVPLAGGLLYSYIAGTSTPQTTYTTNAGNIANSNPIVLDSAGRTPQEIWLTSGATYKFALYTSAMTLIGTYDNIYGAFNGDGLANCNDVTQGDALVAFHQSNASGILSGSVCSTVHNKLQESVSVKDFGASPSATAAQNVVAFQAALDYANGTGSGARIYVPAGTYLLNAGLKIYPKTLLQGDGRQTTILSFNHTGDGIKSSFPINSSIAATICIRDLQLLCTNASNQGSGYVDVGGTFIEVTNIRSQGWKFLLTLDQSEVIRIQNNEFIGPLSGGACLWLVNGPDLTYTNVSNPLTAGTVTVTPDDMSIITASWNANGPSATYMWAENANYTNGEIIQITAVTATTFTATFASNKSTNWRVGSRPGFTNQISVTGCQFNALSSADLIRDDGGACHYYAYNNLNGGRGGYVGAGVGGLAFIQNECELSSQYLLMLMQKTNFGTQRFVGPSTAVTVESNLFGGSAIGNYLQAVNSASIRNNVYYQYSNYGIGYDFGPNAVITDVNISNNAVTTYGQGITTLPLFDDGQISYFKQQGVLNQGAQCYVSSGISPGSQTITPSNAQFIQVGSLLRCMNKDGSNVETVQVTQMVGTNNFVATFTSSKSAGWLIYGMTGTGSPQNDYEEGEWIAAFASGGGSITIDSSRRTGGYVRQGKQVTVTGRFPVSAINTPTGELTITGLPYVCDPQSETLTPSKFYAAGSIVCEDLQATATTSIVCQVDAGTSAIKIRKFAAGALSAMAADVKATSVFTLTLTYFTF